MGNPKSEISIVPRSRVPIGCRVPRSGLTLVELLVVIVLLLILTAVAIPVLAPNVEQRRIREAARLVSLFISGARTRAIELGRPVGVQFERLASNPNASMVLTYVEVPAPYSGETLSSACSIYRTSSGDWRAYMEGGGAGTFNDTLIRRGDFLKIDYQGWSYQIVGPDTDGDPNTTNLDAGADTLEIQPLPAAILRWPIADPADETEKQALPDFPYQITRQPIKASDTPLQLPEGAVVDISLSGFSTDSVFGPGGLPSQPLIAVFYPGGAMGGVYIHGVATSNSLPLHLLIGRSDGVMPHVVNAANKMENISFDNTKLIWNLRDLNHMWVSMGAQTGLVTTTENRLIADANAAYPLDFQGTYFDEAVRDSRSIAQTFQSMGGR